MPDNTHGAGDYPPLPRPEIERVTRTTHGGFNSTRATPLLDFSANINPFGPSPHIWQAMRDIPIGQHPDPRATPLRNVLAAIEGVSARDLLVGNGSVDLLYQLAVAYLRPKDWVLTIAPTFGEYAAAAAIMGAQVYALSTHPDDDFQVHADRLLQVADQINPRLIFLCNPNNPTGTYIERAVIAGLLQHCPNSLLVLDEAFIRFIANAWSSRELLTTGNLLIMRSLTKDYALTGLRVGYALAHPAVIASLEKVQPPWSVNALAQAAAVAALRDEAHLQTSLATLSNAKEELVRALGQLGMRTVPSRVHFFLMHVPSAAEWTRRLLARNILVRDCTSFGLPTFIRIATQPVAENDRLVEALAAVRTEAAEHGQHAAGQPGGTTCAAEH